MIDLYYICIPFKWRTNERMNELKEKKVKHYTRTEREREIERSKDIYKTDDAMGGVVCLELVPKDVANELLFVNAHNW